MLNELSQCHKTMQAHCSENIGARNLLRKQQGVKEAALCLVAGHIIIREQAVLLLTKTAEVARTALAQYIEDTVTPPLQAIWGDDRYFKIRQYIHNSKTQEAGVDFEVFKPVEGKSGSGDAGSDYVGVHPYNASGGGLADVVSAVLQMTLLEISKPRPGGPLCLDEPSKQLDNVKDSGGEDDEGSLAAKQEALAEFIEAYAQSSGRQVLLSSHNSTLIRKANRIIKFEPADAVTCRVAEQ